MHNDIVTDNEKSGSKYGPWQWQWQWEEWVQVWTMTDLFGSSDTHQPKIQIFRFLTPSPLLHAGSNTGIYAYRRNKWPTSWYLDDGLQPQVVLALPTWGTRGTLVTGSLFLIGGPLRKHPAGSCRRGSWGRNATARTAYSPAGWRRGASTEDFFKRSKLSRFTDLSG